MSVFIWVGSTFELLNLFSVFQHDIVGKMQLYIVVKMDALNLEFKIYQTRAKPFLKLYQMEICTTQL